MTSTPTIEALTVRELDVLRLIARGKSNKQIGFALGIKETTVKTHLRSMFAKLNAFSRTEALSIGFRTGLIDVTSLLLTDDCRATDNHRTIGTTSQRSRDEERD
jgi:DNA-binding CsgD family transcriptional regulator